MDNIQKVNAEKAGLVVRATRAELKAGTAPILPCRCVGPEMVKDTCRIIYEAREEKKINESSSVCEVFQRQSA